MVDKKIQRQSGLIQIWILFVSVMFPIFIGFMILMTNVISAKNTVYYSKMVLNGSLYAASHAQDATAMAHGIKKLDMAKAQQLFNQTLQLYRYAEYGKNYNIAQELHVSASNLIIVPPGGTTPRGYKTHNDTLYIEGTVPFTIKLPFVEGEMTSMPITISASQKFVIVNYLDRTIY